MIFGLHRRDRLVSASPTERDELTEMGSSVDLP